MTKTPAEEAEQMCGGVHTDGPLKVVEHGLHSMPEPEVDDHATLLLNELASTVGGFDAKYPIVKRYFDELVESAEALAKRPRVEVPSEVLEWANGTQMGFHWEMQQIAARFILSLSQEPRS